VAENGKVQLKVSGHSALAIDGGTPVRADRLPLHRPWFDGRELAAVGEVLDSTRVAGDGARGRELEDLLRESTGALGVLALNSCTAALEVAVQVAGLGPGDEVILPSFTFVSTANAVIKSGARPVFADIDPKTLGLDLGVRLPLSAAFSDADCDDVIAACGKVFEKVARRS
jgi:DegT/DnrJ/EryC1/StrS aminotransferase family protein